MKLETIILPVLLSAVAGCAHVQNSPIVGYNQPDTFTADRITRLVDRQRAGHSYGDHFYHPDNSNEYRDGFEQEKQVFATIISEREGHLVIDFYGNNIVITDILGDRQIDSAFVFDEKYDFQNKHTNHQWIQKVSSDNSSVRLFEDALLDLIEEKYATGAVSRGSMTQFLTAQNRILY